MTSKSDGRRNNGGPRKRAGRPPSDPLLRELWQATGLRGPALIAEAVAFMAAHLEQFQQWREAQQKQDTNFR